MKLTREMISKEVDKRRDRIIEFGQKLVQMESETFSPNIPSVLDWLVKKGKKDQFDGKIINDAGFPISAWSHWGNKEDWIGIMCHIDTVPYVESEWDHPPLSGKIIDGKIWGRGTQDMKLATVSCYVAMQIFKDLNLDLPRGIKLMYGSQEETGPWTDMSHALDVLGTPRVLLTAEGGWPATQAESGIVRLDIKGQIPNHSNWSIKAGNMYNAVCSEAKLILDGKKHTFKGKAMHTLLTEEEVPDSALPKAMQFLKDNNKSDSFVEWILQYWNNNRFGENTPLEYETSRQGKSLINPGLLEVNLDGTFNLGVDIRYPVDKIKGSAKWHQQIVKKWTASSGFKNVKVDIGMDLPGYFIDDNDPVLKIIGQTYWSISNSDINSKPYYKLKAGTYAKLKDHAIAFGMVMDFKDDIRAHMANEYAVIESWIESTKIFVEILYNLAKKEKIE